MTLNIELPPLRILAGCCSAAVAAAIGALRVALKLSAAMDASTRRGRAIVHSRVLGLILHGRLT
jgi:hypothetical protein